MKRILIFSPYSTDQNRLNELVTTYWTDNLFNEKISSDDFNRVYYIQTFGALHEPKEIEQIGHKKEVLVVCDRRLFAEREDSMKGTEYVKFARAAFDLSRDLCLSKEIPFVIYEGEIEKRIENEFIQKLDAVKSEIQKRINYINSL